MQYVSKTPTIKVRNVATDYVCGGQSPLDMICPPKDSHGTTETRCTTHSCPVAI
jgi:hypothetical protein